MNDDQQDAPSEIGSGGSAPLSSPQVKSGGPSSHFPEILHKILSIADEEGHNDILSWQPHGRCFMIRHRDRLVSEIMPKYFRQTRFASFQRQLNLYGFIRMAAKGPDYGSYYHELFLRGKPELCQTIQRVKGEETRPRKLSRKEPDFYKMPPMPMTAESGDAGYSWDVPGALQVMAPGETASDDAIEPDPISPHLQLTARQRYSRDLLRETQHSLYSMFTSDGRKGPFPSGSMLPIQQMSNAYHRRDSLLGPQQPLPAMGNFPMQYPTEVMQQYHDLQLNYQAGSNTAFHASVMGPESIRMQHQYRQGSDPPHTSSHGNPMVPGEPVAYLSPLDLGDSRHAAGSFQGIKPPPFQDDDDKNDQDEGDDRKPSYKVAKEGSSSLPASPQRSQLRPEELRVWQQADSDIPLSEVVRMARFLVDVDLDSDETVDDEARRSSPSETRSCP